MTKIRPQDTLNHIFPEKGFFYALALVKYRCCILKIPGLGPAPVLQRILYTQISRAQTRSCSAAYTVYSKCRGTGWFLLGSVYCILKFPRPGPAHARQRILIYSNFQSPGLLLLGSVYLYTQNARVRAGFYSIAYTCILKFPGLLPVLQRILYTQISRTRASS